MRGSVGVDSCDIINMSPVMVTGVTIVPTRLRTNIGIHEGQKIGVYVVFPCHPLTTTRHMSQT